MRRKKVFPAKVCVGFKIYCNPANYESLNNFVLLIRNLLKKLIKIYVLPVFHFLLNMEILFNYTIGWKKERISLDIRISVPQSGILLFLYAF